MLKVRKLGNYIQVFKDRDGINEIPREIDNKLKSKKYKNSTFEPPDKQDQDYLKLLEQEKKFFRDNPESSDQKRSFEDTFSQSVARSRRIVKRVCLKNFVLKRTTFLTLTYKDDVRDRQEAWRRFDLGMKRINYMLFSKHNLEIRKQNNLIKVKNRRSEAFNKKVEEFFFKTKKSKKKLLPLKKKKGLKYLCVPELQKRGVYHFHLVLFDVSFISKKKLCNTWREGFVDLKNIIDGNHLANYVSKYFGKDFVPDSEGKKRYSSSTGLMDGVFVWSGQKAQRVFDRFSSGFNQEIRKFDILYEFYDPKMKIYNACFHLNNYSPGDLDYIYYSTDTYIKKSIGKLNYRLKNGKISPDDFQKKLNQLLKMKKRNEEEKISNDLQDHKQRNRSDKVPL